MLLPGVRLMKLWFIFLIVRMVRSLQSEQCQLQTHEVVVNPAASAFIGVVLQVREKGAGLFGCGPPTRDGVEIYEAMRWLTAILNLRAMEIGSRILDDSFIPGVPIGLKVFDSCGRQGSAAQLVADAFPVLREGPAPCSLPQNVSSLSLGLVDGMGSTRDADVRKVVREFKIPVIALDPETIIPAEDKAKAMVAFTHEMEWRQVAVIHGRDDYSSRMFRTLGRLAADSEICLAAVESIDPKDNPGVFQRTLETIFSSIDNGTGILVLLKRSDFKHVLEALRHFPGSVGRYQWFFPDVLTRDDLALMTLTNNLNELVVYSLTLSPNNVIIFEDYWQERKLQTSQRIAENLWLLEYLTTRRKCKLQGWAGPGISNLPDCLMPLDIPEDSLDVTLRTLNVVSGIHVVNTFANALRRAWEAKCQNRPGLCLELVEMPRREFSETYLKPLEFDHAGAGSRIPDGPTGGKIKFGDPSELAAATLGLSMYRQEGKKIHVDQVYSYEYESVVLLNRDFQPIEAHCPSEGCDRCLHVREGRVQGGKKPRLPPHHVISSPQNLYIPALFPVHHSGATPLECGPELDLDAIRQVEAFVWSLNRINENRAVLPGIKLGAILLDTCHSSVRALTQLSSLLSDPGSVVPGLTTDGILAAINSLPLPEAESSADVLAALNITSIATGQSSTALKMPRSLFNLQVEAPLASIGHAIVHVLEYLGWNYATAVYSVGDVESELGFQQFREALTDLGICIAMEEGITSSKVKGANDTASMDELVARLVGARASGARAVVLWTNPSDTRAIMRAVSRAYAHGALRKEDVFWLLASLNGEGRKILEEFGNVIGGALVFSTQHKPVREFLQHLRRLRPTQDSDNPWIHHYYHEVLQCREPECQQVLEIGSPSDSNTVQAVYILGSALARARVEICPDSQSRNGLCAPGKYRGDLKQTLNAYLRYTGTDRADGSSNDDFRFTTSGVGNVAVEILNFRRGPRGRNRSLGNVHYEKVGLFNEKLKNLANILAYRDSGDEVQVASLASQCARNCARCKHQSMERMATRGSQDNLYLAATIGIHDSSERPLDCGSEITDLGVQQLEAFLWAVDQVNRNSSLLPGIKLGALAFDSCDSKERTTRDISNFFSDSGNRKSESSPNENNVVAFLAAGTTEIAKPVVDIVTPLNIPVIVTEASGMVLHRKKHAPYPLQLAPSNEIRAAAILSLLQHFNWKYFSVIYLEDILENEDLHRYLVKEAKAHGLEVAQSVSLPVGSTNIAVRDLLKQLKEGRHNGAKLVVLLMPSAQTDLLLRTARGMQDEGQLSVDDFLWVTIGNEDVLESNSDQVLGSIVLRPQAGWVSEFETHFRNLNISSNTKNPWFPEFWAKVFHCRGASCRSGLYQDLQGYQMKPNPYVVNVINGVLSLAHALESVRRELCPDKDSGVCRNMKDLDRVKRRLFEVAPKMAFVGAGLNGIAFSHSGENAHAKLQVLNFRRIGSDAYGLLPVGQVSLKDGIELDMSKMKAYTENKTEIPLADIVSKCTTCLAAKNKPSSPHILQVPSNRRFSILGLVPFHRQGNSYFNCGEFHSAAMFQNLAALTFALEQVNHNQSVLEGIELGALIFDHCSQPQRAHERLFTFFSGEEGSKDDPTAANSIVAAVTLDEEASELVSPLFEAQGIPQLVSPILHSTKNKDMQKLYLNMAPSSAREVEALFQVVQMFEWRYVLIIHSRTQAAEAAKDLLAELISQDDMCVGGIWSVSKDSVEKDVSEAVLDIQKMSSASVVILLLDSPTEIRLFLEAVAERKLSDRLSFVSGLGWSTDRRFVRGLESIAAGTISLSLENYDIPGFRQFMGSLSLSDHWPFPTAWYEEFHQHTFRCQLKASAVVQNQYPDQCSGNEVLDISSMEQDSNVWNTVRAVWTIARGLHQFLANHCEQHFEAESIADCGPGARGFLNKEILKSASEEAKAGFYLWNYRKVENGTFDYVRIGGWRPGTGLSARPADVMFRYPALRPVAECDSGDCLSVCSSQSLRYAAKSVPQPPPILENFRSMWGVVTSALSIFGAIIALGTAFYFLSAFPRASGTSILGYLILLGVLLLYATNISFIISPTEVTCSARRLLLGLAYAVIFSGMLVKVVNTWRRQGGKDIEDGLTKPSGLLVVAGALILVQVILSSGWLVLAPSQVDYLINGGANGEPLWRCSPVDSFEVELVVSLVYVIVLLIASVLFGLCTWHSEENGREARWILASSVFLIVVWICWTTAATTLPIRHRDFVIVVANLVAAKIVLLCLYARKVYWYSKLSKEAKKLDAQPQFTNPTVYGVTHFQPHKNGTPKFHKTVPGFGSDIVQVGPDIGVRLEDDPTQVIPSTLYPLEMFQHTDSSSEDDNEDEGVESDAVPSIAVVDHCEPGTNEFTAPVLRQVGHRQMLVLDGDDFSMHESVSYI